MFRGKITNKWIRFGSFADKYELTLSRKENRWYFTDYSSAYLLEWHLLGVGTNGNVVKQSLSVEHFSQHPLI